MENLTIPDKTTGDIHYAAEYQAVKDWINEPAQSLTTFDDSGAITIDGTKTYSATRAVTASTHSLTLAASGHKSNNYIHVRYSFSQACTLTLNNFDSTLNNTGTINPIPSGTYDLFFTCVNSALGGSLIIPNNLQSTQSQLSTPANFNAGGTDTQVDLTWTGVANATGYTLEFSTDQSNWTDLSTISYNGTSTSYSHTGLTNGITYYYRVKATASTYLDSSYATDNATPSAGLTQLTAISDLSLTVSNASLILSFTNPNSGNEDDNLVQYSTDNFVADINNGVVLASGATGGTQTGLSNGTLYYIRVICRGSGAYTNSNPSNVDSETPALGTIILLEDNFNDNSIDSAIWDTTTSTFGDVSESSQTLILTQLAGGTAPTIFGLVQKTGLTSANDVLICQVNVTINPVNGAAFYFGFGPSTGYDVNERCYFVHATGSTNYGKLRSLVVDGGVSEVNQNESQFASNKDIRIRYVPSTGDVSFQYWTGVAWSEFRTGNIDLSTNPKVYLLNSETASFEENVIFNNFYLSQNDYSTHYPS